jgi:agmatine/peptidylarginine deiminase
MNKQLFKAVENAVTSSIVENLSGYNNPLSKMILSVIDDNKEDLYNLINKEFKELINNTQFKKSLSEALNLKLAKSLINRMGGELESRVNELKSNPNTRAEITLAINNVIKKQGAK